MQGDFNHFEPSWLRRWSRRSLRKPAWTSQSRNWLSQTYLESLLKQGSEHAENFDNDTFANERDGIRTLLSIYIVAYRLLIREFFQGLSKSSGKVLILHHLGKVESPHPPALADDSMCIIRFNECPSYICLHVSLSHTQLYARNRCSTEVPTMTPDSPREPF